jgi:hypothetical protein
MRTVRRADNLTAICELIVYRMWDPQHLTTLQASTAYYGDIFTLLSWITATEMCWQSLLCL